MKKLEYTVSFNTPAFLGNAEQHAQWRTPPFKALIRQWWRVVKAKEVGYDPAKLREAEGCLFGSAADDAVGSRQSKVRIRLSSWKEGQLTQWQTNGDDTIQHPEVKNHKGEPRPVSAQLYLGYGPLSYRAGGTKLNDDPPRSAIAIETKGHSAELKLMVPKTNLLEIERAAQFAAWFGTLGSRSRNAWGSLKLEGNGLTEFPSGEEIQPYQRRLEECLSLDWPHAVGADSKGPLVWQTGKRTSWAEVMKELAQLKIKFRTRFKFDKPGISDRHILAYPVTKHSVHEWGNQARLANQLRFKVIHDHVGFVGVVVHVPCGLPDELQKKINRLPDQFAVWQAVHDVLDRELGATSKPWRT